MSRERDPRPALAGFYAAQFGHLGIVVPFLPPWLASRGFDAAAIGVLIALPSIFKMAAPWLWGRWADGTGRRNELMLLAVGGAGVSLAALVGLPNGWPLIVGVTLYGWCRAPLLPYAEATSLEQSVHRGFAYGPIRLWGSVAFIVASLGVGAAQERLSGDVALWIGAGCLALGWLAVTRFPRPLPPPQAREAAGPHDSDGRPRVPRHAGLTGAALVAFFVGCALMQTSHGAYYTFYSLHLESLGFHELAVGAFWSLGVICEVALFVKLDAWVTRLGVKPVLLGSLALAALRWLVIGLSTETVPLAAAQVLHAATYAAFHVASIRVVYRSFPLRPAKGQALFSGMTYGVGNVVGSIGAGFLAERLTGGLGPLFLASAGVAAVGLVVLAGVRTEGEAAASV